MKGLKRPLFFAVLVLTVSSCSFIDNLLGKKGGAPTAENPGQFSTATGLRYNDEEKPSFQVTEFEDSLTRQICVLLRVDAQLWAHLKRM